MGLAERKHEEQPEPQEQKALLDSAAIFTRKPLPYKEVDYYGADGAEGKVLIQAISLRVLDEINEIQNQPVKDGRGNVVQDSSQIGWDAKVVARALRKPNKMPMASENWKALAEEILDTWLPGTIRSIRSEVLELSGFGPRARSEQKKDS